MNASVREDVWDLLTNCDSRYGLTKFDMSRTLGVDPKVIVRTISDIRVNDAHRILIDDSGDETFIVTWVDSIGLYRYGILPGTDPRAVEYLFTRANKSAAFSFVTSGLAKSAVNADPADEDASERLDVAESFRKTANQFVKDMGDLCPVFEAPKYPGEAA